MKLGDFFVEIGIQADKKSIQAVEENITALKKLQRQVERQIKLEKELAEATSEEQKERIKKKYQLEDEIETQEESLKQQKASISNFKGMIKGALGVVSAISLMIGVIDRMATALSRSNQKLMNFQHQTGISISTLNKYAQANVSANPLATIEGTAGSLQNVASNLWDIQLGRGDVSAYQELSYFSGEAVEPYGKSLEEVIESVRSALRKIPNDIQATNLIQRMGFSPDDLMMLRMTREEFEKTQELFLNAEQREKVEKLGKELNIIHLRIKLVYDLLVLKVFPILNNVLKSTVLPLFQTLSYDLEKGIDLLNKYPIILKAIELAILGIMIKLHPLIVLFTPLLLMLDDLMHYLTGGGSVIGDILNNPDTEKLMKDKKTPLPYKILIGAFDFMKDFLPDGKLLDAGYDVYDRVKEEINNNSVTNTTETNTISNDNRNNTFNFYGMGNNQLFPLMSSVTGYNYYSYGGNG